MESETRLPQLAPSDAAAANPVPGEHGCHYGTSGTKRWPDRSDHAVASVASFLAKELCVGAG